MQNKEEKKERAKKKEKEKKKRKKKRRWDLSDLNTQPSGLESERFITVNVKRYNIVILTVQKPDHEGESFLRLSRKKRAFPVNSATERRD
jgi:hypothetical protein